MKKAIILWACIVLSIAVPLSAMGDSINLCTVKAVTSLYGYDVAGDIAISIDAGRSDKHLIMDIDGEAILKFEGGDVETLSGAIDKYVRWRNEAKANRHQIAKQIDDMFIVPCLKKNIIIDDEEGLAIVLLSIYYVDEADGHMMLIGAGMLGMSTSDDRLIYALEYGEVMKIKNSITEQFIAAALAEHRKKQEINDLYK